ncbi:helix-turn-helix transcriptional regulator [Brevundimonas sp. 3P9-tot-E]|uniref:helix-turn-helix domain-containing protein n=1 Tax=unclassified Brevundimonas TaxID=2622653 RepID=UPI0039A02B4A
MKRSATEFDKELGAQVRNARVGARMTQSELGAAIGVTFQQIQKYEHGANRISASMLLQLSQALNVDFSAAVALEGARPSSEVRSGEEERLLADFARLDVVRQRLVLDLVRTLACA